jgi:hypothetical protein
MMAAGAMAKKDQITAEQAARDVLAAEEFAVGAADPALHHEPAHDVLAAEEFAVGAADPSLGHGRVVLPDDPTGIAEPHDVLAAEEFALPAPRSPGAAAGLTGSARSAAFEGDVRADGHAVDPAPGPPAILRLLGGAVLALTLLRALRRGRRG